MNINENPAAPDAREAAIDALLDAIEGPHDCGTCEWCIASVNAVAQMVPSNAVAPF